MSTALKRRRVNQAVPDVPSPRLLKTGTPKKAGKTSILATKTECPVGRPTKFDPVFCQQVAKLCRLGATDKEIADFFNISTGTLDRWKRVHPEFLSSIKEGKIEADAHVADALYRRAIGYSHSEIDIRTVAMGGGAGSEIIQTPTMKHYAPDTTAAIFWLKNRQPNTWGDRLEVNTAEFTSLDALQVFADRMNASRERQRMMLAERAMLGYTGG